VISAIVDNIYDNLRFPTEGLRGKPYLVLNLVQSTDGKASIGGKASGLGTDVDRTAMRALRAKSDAVMVGGGTIRAEKLSLSLDAEDMGPVPRAVILTNSGDIPLESNLVRDPRQKVLVLLPESAGKGAEKHVKRLAEIRRVPAVASGEIDVQRAVEILNSDYGIEVLLCEGGPTLNRALIESDLVDELFLTIAPMLVGEQSLRHTSTPAQGRLRPLGLISSQVVGDEVFLRYALNRAR
jgi:riboflavin-specific deaminase-like protein